ncbi:DUF3309 domain-containing protein [Pseudomonas sp. LA21]|uniref:DUF3309 family protein n=1 Tax=unclassified Pseudomonas TaxID=196821 RepID=UPI001A9D3AFF|nr:MULTISPECIES: DUF3309 family protein [unclassified Pseudomonas]MCJ1885119.1 DUF3309 domain-containing protein [Pseudomonas sp. LA21]
MGLGTILLIILILLLIGGLPVFPHSRNWGYGPSGVVGVVLVVLLVLILLGHI